MATTLLEEELEAWGKARSGLIEEAKNIPAGDFDFRPVPDVRSVKGILLHSINAARMMTGELTRDDSNFHLLPRRKLLELYAVDEQAASQKEELVELLDSQFQETRGKFSQVGELHMWQLIQRFDGEWGTRLSWLQQAIAHEMYHRGQLTLYERLLGIIPVSRGEE